MTEAVASPPPALGVWRGRAPGIALALAVALASFFSEPLLKSLSGGRIGLPAMVIALILGVLLNPVANRREPDGKCEGLR